MLVILGLVFSTISPACAFMSGQAGVMEICGADGTIKTVSLPAEYDPFATVDEQAPAPDSKSGSGKCPFCLHFSSLKAQATPAFEMLEAPVLTAFITAGPGSVVFASTPDLGFHPTGPPAILFI